MKTCFWNGIGIVATCAVAGALCVPAKAGVINSINAMDMPSSSVLGIQEEGWVYTPATSYSLGGVDTLFSSLSGVTNQQVTERIWSAPPSLGGAVLRTGTFLPVAGAFSGATFAPLALTGGQNYFVSFSGVLGYGANATAASNSRTLTEYYDTAGDRSFQYIDNSDDIFSRPILQFFSSSAPVPEPDSLFLIAAGLIGMAALGRRGGRAAASD